VILARKPEDHDDHDQRVVRAQEPLENDEQADGDQVSGVKVEERAQSGQYSSKLSRLSPGQPLRTSA
jgi:hypothetical protein